MIFPAAKKKGFIALIPKDRSMMARSIWWTWGNILCLILMLRTSNKRFSLLCPGMPSHVYHMTQSGIHDHTLTERKLTVQMHILLQIDSSVSVTLLKFSFITIYLYRHCITFTLGIYKDFSKKPYIQLHTSLQSAFRSFHKYSVIPG